MPPRRRWHTRRLAAQIMGLGLIVIIPLDVFVFETRWVDTLVPDNADWLSLAALFVGSVLVGAPAPRRVRVLAWIPCVTFCIGLGHLSESACGCGHVVVFFAAVVEDRVGAELGVAVRVARRACLEWCGG